MAEIAQSDAKAKHSQHVESLFPFTPYDVQSQLMDAIYSAIDSKSIGLFESPTGTGKTLSILSSSLRWLFSDDEKRYSLDHDSDQTNTPTNTKAVDWVAAFTAQNEQREKKDMSLKRTSFLSKMGDRVKKDNRVKFQKISKNKRVPRAMQNAEDDFLIESDNDARKAESSDDSGDEGDFPVTQLVYCSRTHSQLVQFVNEAKKIKTPERLRCVTLGSRKNMCINDDVLALKSLSKINDQCLDLRDKKKKSKGSSSSGCSFHSLTLQSRFRDHLLTGPVRDMEDIVTLGKQLDACPYYGTRKAVAHAHLIAMPYTCLLQKSMRESLGVKVKDNVIIIDEAHNLIETLNQVHSYSVTLGDLQRAYSQLEQYFVRYELRLNLGKAASIRKVLVVLRTVLKYFDTLKEENESESSNSATNSEETNEISRIWTVNDFEFETDLDNINFSDMSDFLSSSKIIQKIRGFSEKHEINTEESEISDLPRHVSCLGKFNDFINALSNSNSDGRVVVTLSKDNPKLSSIRFLMLNASIYFKEIIENARSVILIGGTMKPFDHFTNQIFPSCSRQISTFSCGHVIPPSNLASISVGKGPSGVSFNFSFGKRNNPAQVKELGGLLANVCTVVPDGVVIFLPSFDFESFLFEQWGRLGVLKRIHRKKEIFREPRTAQESEEVLRMFSEQIKSSDSRGALLICVVGAKMSEGINFSNEMARCVIMVGLPYPNPTDPELMERMAYLNGTVPSVTGQPSPGDRYYQSLCMRAVNQSIGRAIRWKGDYASILMVDERYAHQRIVKQLPEWIQERHTHSNTFPDALRRVVQFFRSKKTVH
eukprot:898105_1